MTFTAWQREHEQQNGHQHQKPVMAAVDGKRLQERRLPSIAARKKKIGHTNMLSDRYGIAARRTGLPLVEMTQVTTPTLSWMSLRGVCDVCIQNCNFEKHGVAVPR